MAEGASRASVVRDLTCKDVKETFYCLGDELIVGAVSTQGWSADSAGMCAPMEETSVQPHDHIDAFFLVVEAHEQQSISDFLSTNIYISICDQLDHEEGDVTTAIEQGFLNVETKMREEGLDVSEGVGASVLLLMICDGVLYCANVGDSRAVGYINGEVLPLSVDHKPNEPKERARIEAAESFVTSGKVEGELRVSRAFGHFSFKQNRARSSKDQAVTCFPEVNDYLLDRPWEFIVLACERIWQVMSNEEVCSFIKERIDSRVTPSVICDQLLVECFNKHPPDINKDNMTVVLLVFAKRLPENHYKEDEVD